VGFSKDDAGADNNFRSIILFGANVASYKFALGASLLDLAGTGIEKVTLEELAAPFSRHLCEHLAEVNVQGTFAHSRFLDACRHFNSEDINETELITATAMLGFNNVIDAFHVVSGSDVPTRFFVDERKTASHGIRLTDQMLALAGQTQAGNLAGEVQGRWNLVERAWESRAASEPLHVMYDRNRELLVPALLGKRRPITEARLALNGYQQGHCFYCYESILVVPNSPAPADVDHVFPYSLMSWGVPIDLDQVWNLVLACLNCNRGVSGKSATVPADEYLQQLHRRNEYLIASHHPLRETLIQQTGATPWERRQFLKGVSKAVDDFGARRGWRPPTVSRALR